MAALRYVYVLALVVWLGGMIVIGAVVAPAAFQALEQADLVAGRSQAATVVGEVLSRFHVVSYAAGGLMLALLAAMKVVGPRPPGFGLRMAIVAVMLASSLLSGLLVDRQIARLRDSIGVPVATLAAGDPRRASFGRLHALSSALMMLGVAGGLVLLYWETRE